MITSINGDRVSDAGDLMRKLDGATGEVIINPTTGASSGKPSASPSARSRAAPVLASARAVCDFTVPTLECYLAIARFGSISVDATGTAVPPRSSRCPSSLRCSEQLDCTAGSTDRCNTFRELLSWGLI